jgi:hypothetical protein
MKFRNYCIVVMGDTKGVLDEIVKISETKPNTLDARGVLIATFSSIAEPNELTEWFTENNRNFLIFDLDKKSSGFNIIKKEVHEGLFGFINDIDVDEMAEKFIRTIDLKNDNVDFETQAKNIRSSLKENKLNPKEIEEMGPKERQNLLNELIEFGLEKLTEEDKKLLPLLAK